jgi:SH3-like domain-containing protein
MKYLAAVLMSLMLSGLCQAKTMSINVETADVFSAPVESSSYVVLQVPRYYPLLSDAQENGFSQVSDFLGRTGWVRTVQVNATPSVVIAVKMANVREKPGTNHRIVFKASKGVAFKIIDENKDWFSVVHENGKRGWIAKSLTWGASGITSD